MTITIGSAQSDSKASTSTTIVVRTVGADVSEEELAVTLRSVWIVLQQLAVSAGVDDELGGELIDEYLDMSVERQDHVLLRKAQRTAAIWSGLSKRSSSVLPAWAAEA